MQKKWLVALLLVAVGLLFGFLRIYRLDTLSTFGRDQGIDFLAVRTMVIKLRPSLLGIKTSIGEFHQGPIYRWMLIPGMALSRFSPLSGAVTAVIVAELSLVAMMGFYYQVWGGKTALLAGMFYAVSPEMIVMGSSPLYQNFIPFFFFLSLAFWWWSRQNSSLNWLGVLLAGLFAGLTFELHYLAVSWVVTLLVLTALYCTPKLKAGVLYVAGLLLAISPTLAFELRHDFLNSRLFYRYLASETGELVSWPEKISTWVNGSAMYLAGLDTKLGLVLIIFIVGLAGAKLLRSGRKDDLNTVVVVTLAVLAGVTAIFSLTEPHYLLAVWLLAFGYLAQSTRKYNAGLWQTVLAVLVGVNLLAVLPRYSWNHGYNMPNGWSVKSIQTAGRIIAADLKKSGTRNFNVASLLDGDTRTYPMRFTLETMGYSPLPATSFDQTELSYVVAPPETKFYQTNVWEIYSLKPFKISRSWRVNREVRLYKLERVKL